MHTFNNNQRDYTDWYTVPRFEGSLEPLMAKLFSKDIFQYNKQRVDIISSPFREYKFHTGVLILQGNKTFGKTKVKTHFL